MFHTIYCFDFFSIYKRSSFYPLVKKLYSPCWNSGRKNISKNLPNTFMCWIDDLMKKTALRFEFACSNPLSPNLNQIFHFSLFWHRNPSLDFLFKNPLRHFLKRRSGFHKIWYIRHILYKNYVRTSCVDNLQKKKNIHYLSLNK